MNRLSSHMLPPGVYYPTAGAFSDSPSITIANNYYYSLLLFLAVFFVSNHILILNSHKSILKFTWTVLKTTVGSEWSDNIRGTYSPDRGFDKLVIRWTYEKKQIHHCEHIEPEGGGASHREQWLVRKLQQVQEVTSEHDSTFAVFFFFHFLQRSESCNWSVNFKRSWDPLWVQNLVSQTASFNRKSVREDAWILFLIPVQSPGCVCVHVQALVCVSVISY